MRRKTDLAPAFDIEVIARDELGGAAEYARRKISGLGRVTRQPVLFARVKLTKHFDPAVARPVIAQANVDVDGRLVRAQVEGVGAREAIDRLEARLRRRLERVAEHWEPRRGGREVTSPGEWRHESESTHRPSYFPRPEDERKVVRHKAYTLSTSTVEEAALEMDLLDYDFHLFVEEGTNQDSVIYRAGPTGYRLAQAKPVPAERLARFELPVTISPQPAPRLTVQEAIERLGLLGLPFLFFVEAEQNGGCVLYHRYDGHYGLITAAT